MNRRAFNQIADNLRHAVATERGEATAPPPLERIYSGDVLVEIRENGVTTWKLAEAEVDAAAVFTGEGAPNVGALREALQQSQPGMARLLGVPVGTYRGWERRRRAPEGSAIALIRVAVQRPDALLSVLQPAEQEAAELETAE